MKKFLSILLIVCMLASVATLLASCEHECVYSENWSSNDTDHWHACISKGCTLTSDKAAHTWDDSVITTDATQEADGVKTFTCTTCKKTRTETVIFSGMNRETWDDMLKVDNFKNFTFTQTTVVSSKGISATTTVTYYVTEAELLLRMEIAGTSEDMSATGTEVADTVKDMTDTFKEMCNFDNFEYDAATKTYRATTEISTPMVSDGVKSSDFVLRVENGKLAEFTFTGKMASNDEILDTTNTITFTNYGTTEIPE